MKPTVISLMGIGLVFAIGGAMIALASWPEPVMTEAGYTSVAGLEVAPNFEDSGSWAGVLIGSLLSMSGQISVAIAIIAIGVYVGHMDNPDRAHSPIQ